MNFDDANTAEIKPGGRYRIAKLLAVFLISPVLCSFLLLGASSLFLDSIGGQYSYGRNFFLGGLIIAPCVSWVTGPLAYAANGGGYRVRHKLMLYALIGGMIGLIVSVFVTLVFGVGDLTMPFALVAIGQGVAYAIWLWICLLVTGLFGPRSMTRNG